MTLILRPNQGHFSLGPAGRNPWNPAQDLFIQTGQTVTFHLSVTNTGDTTLTTVPLSYSSGAR